LTIFLNLTNRIEAGIKATVNSSGYNSFYDVLLRLVDDERKNEVIDPTEEESFILEFKTYWLMCILTFRNSVAKEYFKSIGIFRFIERKSEKFCNVIDLIVKYKTKGGFSESKITAISKNISKFCEFVYYLIVNDTDEIIEFKKKQKNFNALKDKIDENKNNLILLEKDIEVFNWIQKIYKMTDLDYV
jgi:hypothetical protein